jgi:hypothetical protein
MGSKFIQPKEKLAHEAPLPSRPAKVCCVVCLRNQDKKTTASCSNCERPMCVKHMKYICQIFLDSDSNE